MRIINLASGSDGNITYIENGDTKLLLDDGLSCSETVKRLEKISISPNEIDAIIISHEHSDHIKGVDVFSSKFNTPVYAPESVWLGLDQKFKKVSNNNRRTFSKNHSFKDIEITSVEVPHDVKCFGYSFESDNKKISVLTDLGHLNDEILYAIKGSGLVYLEANYDKQLLMKSVKYPLSLKLRIDGPRGHLSNNASCQAVEYLAKNGTRQIVLSHLSRENNTPNLAYTTICSNIKKNGIIEGEDIMIDVAGPSISTMFKLK